MSKGIVTPLITIGLNAEKKLTIAGPLENKADCVLILADALKLVAVYENEPEEKSKIVVPKKGPLVVPGRV